MDCQTSSLGDCGLVHFSVPRLLGTYTTPVSNSGNTYQGIPAELHTLPGSSTYSNTVQDTDQKDQSCG